jgi:polyisoprenyl-phosphate glycosyltransferase
MKAIDIVCPVFREEGVIRVFHARLAAVANSIADRFAVQIIYVVDPSTDGTEAALSEITDGDRRVEVLVMSRRFGHQLAIVAGIDHSEADAVIMLDSDLQHPPELIPELIGHWEDGADIVQTLRRDGAETDVAKRVTSRLFYRMLYKIGSIELRTGAADYRLMSSRVARIFRDEIREHNPFIRGLVSWVGFKTVFVPFEPGRREYGESKYHASSLLNFALNGICSFSSFPLRLCVTLGFSVAALSLVLALAQVIIYIFGTREVPGWASIFTIVSFFSGFQLFFLGVLGEYVTLIFDEVKNRPRYLIDRKYPGKVLVASRTPHFAGVEIKHERT